MNRNSNNFPFTLKIAVLLLLLMVYFVTHQEPVMEIMTQLLQKVDVKEHHIQEISNFVINVI